MHDLLRTNHQFQVYYVIEEGTLGNIVVKLWFQQLMLQSFASWQVSLFFGLPTCALSFPIFLYPSHSFSQAIERDLNDVSSRAETLTRERQQLETERQDFIRQRAKLELSVKDLEDGVSEHSRGKVRGQFSVVR